MKSQGTQTSRTFLSTFQDDRTQINSKPPEPSIVPHNIPQQLFSFIIALLCLYFAHHHLSRRPPSKPQNMAWMSSGSSNAALIKNLASNGLITSERVKNAMLSVRPPAFASPPPSNPYNSYHLAYKTPLSNILPRSIAPTSPPTRPIPTPPKQ